jgi:hypothetical protein
VKNPKSPSMIRAREAEWQRRNHGARVALFEAAASNLPTPHSHRGRKPPPTDGAFLFSHGPWQNHPGRAMTLTASTRRLGLEVCKARAAERAAKLAPIVKELQAAGITSLSGIAAALTARGVPTPAGRQQWYANQVSLLLKRLNGSAQGAER